MPLSLRLPRPAWASQWRLPRYLSAIPLPALRLISLLVLINGIVWAAAGVLLRTHHTPDKRTPALD